MLAGLSPTKTTTNLGLRPRAWAKRIARSRVSALICSATGFASREVKEFMMGNNYQNRSELLPVRISCFRCFICLCGKFCSALSVTRRQSGFRGASPFQVKYRGDNGVPPGFQKKLSIFDSSFWPGMTIALVSLESAGRTPTESVVLIRTKDGSELIQGGA
jgi:hypothetical protein